MRNQAWANYVKDKRKARGLTRRKLAELAGIDPSYVTLIERDGYVPRKDKVLEVARALEAEVDHTLLVAGYAPEKIPVKDLLERLETFKSEKVLDKELRASIRELFDLTTAQQKKVSEMLTAYVKTLKDQKKARTAARVTRSGRGTGLQA
jgi:transcriptional regulator with XRE-family HTH domain